ncbi:MAG: aldehyde dehydrogenase family protein, partial [Verrucomicrobiales bacterium]|nr:aldehyde dehydrogenase family protein [Verrucomicrobiales bacterium]
MKLSPDNLEIGYWVAIEAAGTAKDAQRAWAAFPQTARGDAVTSATAFGSFLHQSQICFAINRHLVHELIANAYGEKLAQRARNLHVGAPGRSRVHLGPIINEQQAARAERILKTSVDAGARVTAGGTREVRFFQP